ncbi:MAG: 50S ribosomal protein L23 [Candidatus Parcubacteria bacterium]|nr:50S ribosomal protein L23 [Candidatus Parcubacteria bacterium]
MALFDFVKKKKKKGEEKTEKVAEGEPRQGREKKGALAKASNFVSGIFIKPHIAEKSTLLNEKGIYVFEIDKNTNKSMVKQAVKEKYGVLPRKVNIINIPSKKISFRGKKGTKRGFKKAIVCLKKGDKIELA